MRSLFMQVRTIFMPVAAACAVVGWTEISWIVDTFGGFRLAERLVYHALWEQSYRT
jgi:hypothetical protein